MMDREFIMGVLPHRDPFLLIDEVLELVPGERAVAIKRVREDEFWTQGHFPGNAVMPGVLIIEAMAQAGAMMMLTLPQFKGKTGYMAGVDGARFKRMVRPGDTLTLTVELAKLRGPIGVGRALAEVSGERAAYGDLTFAIK